MPDSAGIQNEDHLVDTLEAARFLGRQRGTRHKRRICGGGCCLHGSGRSGRLRFRDINRARPTSRVASASEHKPAD